MKYLIVSDIHGSSDSARFIADKFNKEGFDYILCFIPYFSVFGRSHTGYQFKSSYK